MLPSVPIAVERCDRSDACSVALSLVRSDGATVRYHWACRSRDVDRVSLLISGAFRQHGPDIDAIAADVGKPPFMLDVVEPGQQAG